MTKVTYKQDERNFDIEFDGHANYAETGKDIVCSAISTVANLIVDGLAAESDYIDFEWEFDNGKARIKAVSKHERGEIICGAIYNAAVNTLSRIAEKYPENLSIIA